VIGTAILAISLFLGVIAIAQSWSPFQCIRLLPNLPGLIAGIPDGRPCESNTTCRQGEEPGEDHMCEKVGPFGTTSIGHGRVRYLGILMDPNELGLALAICLPFAMAPFAARRTLWRLLLMIAAFAIVFPVVVLTESRTGQVAFITVIMVYVVQRVRWTTITAAAVLAIPILMLGGRSGGEADESSLERLEAWSSGFDMLKSSPIWGIGRSQFGEHWVGMTAHNSFVLAAAELGFVGLVLWLCVFYVGLKIVILARRRYRDRDDRTLAHGWARALLASLCAAAAGINFLSLSSHPIVWAYLALPGAYYLAARRHDPEFRVTFGTRDLLAVTGCAILYLASLKAYLVMRGI
jgi:O-antigen ligase